MESFFMKQELINRIKQNLMLSQQEHDKERNSAFAKSKEALKLYQKERLTDTHADLLLNRETRQAGLFFLNDIYGSSKIGDRHKDLERIIPTMEKLFPEPALEVIADAISLNAMTEVLDGKMATILGQNFTPAQYDEAYRQVATREEREAQIQLVQNVGYTLADLVKLPLISTTLKVMTLPAKLGGLMDMHEFLSKGFQTFKEVKNPRAFIDKIIEKEKEELNKTYQVVTKPKL